MTRQRLLELLERFHTLTIAVLGDLFLDRYWMIDPKLDEVSLETGLTAWQVMDTRLSAGAAGTVLNNLSELGLGKLYAISLLGEDGEGQELIRLLISRGVDLSYLVQSPQISTPFYTKLMYKGEDGLSHEGNRVDRKNHGPVQSLLETKMIEGLHCAAQFADAIILLDQLIDEDTGVVTAPVRKEAAIEAKERPNLVMYADSRAFIHRFLDISVKCNNVEATALTGVSMGDNFDLEKVFQALKILQGKTNRPVFVTCQAHGIAVIQDGKPILLPAARHVDPIDVVGAGDASTAGIVSALCAGATPAEAAEMGNLCAGVTVRKIGTTGTAKQAEVLALFDEQFGDSGT